MTRAVMEHGVLDDAMVEEMRAKVGFELRIDHSRNHDLATRFAILRFCEGIGDTNPLWADAEHASASDYGALVAPPTWVLCCFSGLQFGWPGLGSFHSASRLRFHRPVLIGDRIDVTCTYAGFSGPRASSFAGQMVVDHFANRYRNDRGELVAEIDWDVVNYERGARISKVVPDSAKPNGSGDAAIEHVDPAVIDARVLAERPRGREPRWWDDVEVGGPLGTVTKGPIGLTDEVAFVASGAAPIPRLAAHRAALVNYDKHPAWGFRDPATGATEPIYSVHYNDRAAQAMGVASAYDVGFQRQCWQVHLLTDWIGDAGWVRSCDAEYRKFVHLGDVVTLGGEIVDKWVDGDEGVVTVRTWAVNQAGIDVMPGHAELALPRRDDCGSPVARRIRPGGR
jgi:acyl dehydratase